MHQFREFVVRDHARAFGVHRHVHRLGHTDGIGHLNLALARQTGRHDVLGHIAGGIGGRAVHLRWIFAAEGAATVRAGTAIGVHNDLAPGQATVALRAANDETSGRVDQVFGVSGQPGLGQHGFDDVFNHRFDKRRLHMLTVAHVGAVLARQHHGVNAVRFAVHIAHGDLALGVRPQERHATIFAQLGLALHQTVGVVNGRGHQLGRFIAGITKHQALVAGAGVEVVV